MGIDTPNEVVALFAEEDVKKARELAGSRDLRETMQRLGVIDKPELFFLN